MFTIEESPEEKKKRRARERKQEQRARDAALDVKECRFDMGKGTQDALTWLKDFGGFEQDAEVMTLMIHTAKKTLERDPSQFENVFNVKRTASLKRKATLNDHQRTPGKL